MAKSRIQGITIQLDGETKGLDKALGKVNKRSNDLASELREVEKALKFNPGNTDLLAQQQKLLADQVENSTKKLNQLKDAQQDVEKQLASGKIGQEEYRAFQREIIKTESQIDGFKKKLASVDDSNALDNVEKDLKDVKKEAGEAEGSIGELGSTIGGLAAGVGAAVAIDQALDFSNLDTQIDISFNVPEESKQSVKGAIKDIGTYGIDAEEALEGVRRQWALNADASDETNTKVTKGAAAISKAYAGIDFTELIQETNEIAETLGISDEEALGLADSLMKAGFPPEQIDIIAEYGQQLSDAGYNAEEIQGIMAAGVDTGTWNIDNLLDGIKEGRIRLAEFGDEIPTALDDLLEKTDISSSQMQEWGSAVAKGGEGGRAAMEEVATALNGVEDETTKNALGAQIFGTIYEDQGQNIIDTLLNAEGQMTSTKENQDSLNESVKQLDSSPAVQMKQAFNDIKTALAPLMESIAEFISKIANWVSENPKLTATILAVVSAVGILMAIFLALSPIVTALGVAAGALGIGMLPLIGIIALIVAAIAGLIAAGVWLWQNWDTVKAKAIEIWNVLGEFFVATWEWIKQTFTTAMEGIKIGISTAWNWIKETTAAVWEAIKTGLSVVWEWIKIAAVFAFNSIKDGITVVWNVIKTVTTAVWNGIKSFVTGLWNGIKTVAMTVFNGIKTVITTIWNGIKTVTSAVWNGIKSLVTGLWNGIKSTATTVFNAVKGSITTVWNAIKSTTSSVWSGIKSTLSGIWNGLKGTVSRVFDSIKNTITGVWDSVSGSTDRIWEGITDSVKGAVNGVIGAINGMINALNNLDIKLPKIPDWVPGMGGKGGGSIGFPNIPNVPYLDVGTNYVKKDGLAMIHEGEAVVPKKYNPAAGGSAGIDYDEMVQAMVRGLNLQVSMDGRVVGQLVEPHVTNNQNRKQSRGRRM